MVEGVLILRNSSLKLKTVVDNAILQNYAVSSENISKRIKFKTENLFYLEVNVRYSDRNEIFTPKIVAPQTFVYFFLQPLPRLYGDCAFKPFLFFLGDS